MGNNNSMFRSEDIYTKGGGGDNRSNGEQVLTYECFLIILIISKSINKKEISTFNHCRNVM